jgi:phosphatidate cytidylyltransferase
VDERADRQGPGERPAAPLLEETLEGGADERAPMPRRARIAAAEAAVVAGLVPSTPVGPRERLRLPGEPGEPEGAGASTQGAGEPGRGLDVPAAPETGADAPSPPVSSFAEEGAIEGLELPDWSDPPTGQVPRVLLEVAEQAGERPLGRGASGPTWRESSEDWEEDGFELAELGDEPVEGLAPEDLLDLELDFPLGHPPGRGSDLAGDGRPAASGAAGQGAAEEPDPAVSRSARGSRAVRPEPDDEPGAQGSSRPVAEAPFEPGVGPAAVPRSAAGSRRHAAGGAGAARGGSPRGSRPARPTMPSRGSRSGGLVRTLTGLAVAAVALGCLLAGPLASLVLVAVVLLVATGELLGVLRRAGRRPATLVALLGTPAAAVGAYLRGPSALPLVLALVVVFALLWHLFGPRRSVVADVGATLLGFGWVGLLGSYAALMLDPSVYPDRHGVALFGGAVLATVGYDVGAYAVGSRFGRHLLLPEVSPAKTWEGLAGGMALAFAVAAAGVSQVRPWDLGSGVALGLVVAVVAPLGDLVESMVKRDLRLKDMGSLLPAHGGVLDRVDAMLFVMPATYFLVRLLHVG